MKKFSTACLIVLGLGAYYASLYGQPTQVVVVDDGEPTPLIKPMPYVAGDRPSKTVTIVGAPKPGSPKSGFPKPGLHRTDHPPAVNPVIDGAFPETDAPPAI